MSNLDASKLAVFDLESGFRHSVHPSKGIELLMPWTFYQGTDAPMIRMWSGLRPDNPLSYIIRTINDEQPMYHDLIDFLRAAKENEWYVTTWNGVYDLSVLMSLRLLPLIEDIRWIDGMQLLKRVRSNDFRLRDELGNFRVSFGLKSAVNTYFPGFGDYGKGVDFLDPSKEMTATMAEYCVKDSIFTHTLTLMLANALSPREWNNALIEARSMIPVAHAYVEGVPLDKDAITTLASSLNDAHVRAREKLYDLDPTLAGESINFNSPQQLREIVYSRWMHTEFKQTESGEPSVDKEVLIKLADVDPRCKALLDIRTATRNMQKFVETPSAAISFLNSNIVHPQCNINGTYTGRMTITSSVSKKRVEQTGIALHQWKRDPEYRKMIKGPVGCVIVEADAAGQEFRWMAIESGDEAMLALCADGEDPHAFMGAAIRHDDYKLVQTRAAEDDAVYKAVRHQGKVSNLSCQYRTSANKLRTVAKVQYGLDLSESEAMHIHQTYRMTYPGVPRYWNRQINKARMDGCVWTLGGRRLEITGDWGDSNIAWSMESSAINFPIQGVGADQKYLAIQLVRPLLNGFGARFMFDLHDGLFFAVPAVSPLTLHKFCTELKRVLNNLPYQSAWGFNPPIPLPWDIKVGKNWGSMMSLEQWMSMVPRFGVYADAAPAN